MKERQEKISSTRGDPFPLGVTRTYQGWNFAIYSQVPICALVLRQDIPESPLIYLTLDKRKNSSGNIWHISLDLPFERFYYAYQVEKGEEKILVHDPYAQLLETKNSWGKSIWHNLKKIETPFALVCTPSPFDWKDTKRIQLAREDLIIYEMHIRGFTKDSSSNVADTGTFLGVKEKIPYLKELGVTAVEFLPVYEFDETEYPRTNPVTGELLYNFWGYSPLSFFSPTQRFAKANSADAGAEEFKELVRELHSADIEVLIDVVFNHTGEGNEKGRTLSWKGFAEDDYYIKGPYGEFLNFTGCGNTLNCNHPAVSDLIIASLRHWVLEYHVDGFRFDLASIFTRGQDGRVLDISPIIDRISQDPILAYCHLIAEPWDASGLHQVGRFFTQSWHSQEQWMEWNDDFRSTVRCFIKGTPGYAGKFATKLCGSQDQYGNGGSPHNSINYITSHDGFSLKDLISYNHKHNEENGEDNRDGMDNNDSWNCGTEGATTDSHILALRERQMKNFCMALLLSQGVPMILMGDEYGHSKNGNNNTWCHDNQRNWFLWDELEHSSSLFRFWKALIAFRKEHPILKRSHFLTEEDIAWHGLKPYSPDWSEKSQFVAYTLKEDKKDLLYVAFNGYPEAMQIFLPKPPTGTAWTRIVNTGLLPPQDFCNPTSKQKVMESIKLVPYSSCLLKALPSE